MAIHLVHLIGQAFLGDLQSISGFRQNTTTKYRTVQYSQNWMYRTGDYRNPPSFGIASPIPEIFAGCIGILPISLFGIES